ncbi:uncharacterized protein LOC134252139 [Saccostrea cucullata]|uniref:uncharacterized protein LOC134252139 n=1 Tax=Saccostrea cuccullata TaxID=36930 RepID=UPI002ED4CB13
MDSIYLINILILFLCIHVGLAQCKGCAESLATLSIVSKCPHDYESWKTAAKRKHCESIAKIQRCSKPEEFVYHCLINNWENATVEVCAPTWYINGFCAQFNIPEGRILNHLQRDCTSLPIPCPSHYISSEAYKYPECFLKAFSNPKNNGCRCMKNVTETGLAEGQERKCTKCAEIYIPALAVLAVISAVLLILLVLLCIVYKRSEKFHRQQSKNMHKTDVETQLMHTCASHAFKTGATNTYSEGYQTYLDGQHLTEKRAYNWHNQRIPKEMEQLEKFGNPEKSGRFTVQLYREQSQSDLNGVGKRDIYIRSNSSGVGGASSLQETSF